MPNAAGVQCSSAPRGGSANITAKPRMLMVETESSRSSSSAPITGVAAMIALVPQMAVPHPTSSAVLREVDRIRPARTAAQQPHVMEATITARAGAPTRATSAKLTLAPVSTMVTGMTRFTRPLQSSITAAGSGTVLRTNAPSTIARIAALANGISSCSPQAHAATATAAASPACFHRSARRAGVTTRGRGSSRPSMESSEAKTSGLMRLRCVCGKALV